MVISAKQNAYARIVCRSVVVAVDDMVGLQAVRAAAHGTLAGGVDLLAPRGGVYSTPPTPITPGNSAIALF